jgi:ribosome maturation factor RimP
LQLVGGKSKGSLADDVGLSPTSFVFDGTTVVTPDQLLDLVRATLEEFGFELVDLRQLGSPSRPVLKVRADRSDPGAGAAITTDDCAVLSRALERRLETGGAVGVTYVLEVSSPGVERPVRFPEHWRRYIGRRVVVRAAGVPGRPTVVICGVPDDATVELALPGGEQVRLALRDVKEATLVYDWPAPGMKRKK